MDGVGFHIVGGGGRRVGVGDEVHSHIYIPINQTGLEFKKKEKEKSK